VEHTYKNKIYVCEDGVLVLSMSFQK